MAGVSSGALVSMPSIVTDVDYPFTFAFYDGNTNTPHSFDPADTFELTILPKVRSYGAIQWRTDDIDPVFTANANRLALAVPQSITGTLVAGAYSIELRRLGADGTYDLLAYGGLRIQAGLSLASGGSQGLSQNDLASVNIIYTNAVQPVVYPGCGPASGLVIPVGGTAPSPPADGYGKLFFDTGTGQLKLVLSNGVILVPGAISDGQLNFSDPANSGLSTL